jgi:pimeloyl-ACP methyl ester carboxylesterase
VPARFRARFPVEITIDPVQQRASAEDTATLNAAAALLQPHYSRLRVPLAIITGGLDAIVDARDHSCQLHQQAPESTLSILPGQGHMIHYSAKGQIGRAVDSLMGLASAKPKRSSRGSSSFTPWPWVLP